MHLDVSVHATNLDVPEYVAQPESTIKFKHLDVPVHVANLDVPVYVARTLVTP